MTKQEFTERQVADELGIDRLELHLAAAHAKLGHYDGITHLLVFSDAEVDELAARLGLARRRQLSSSSSTRAAIPEPSGE